MKPHPFVIANHLQHASFINLPTALAYYGLVPETIQSDDSITAGRPKLLTTPLGTFAFRPVKPELLHGYRMLDLRSKQALVATPEKALHDLIYLQPDGDSPVYLREMRLQNLALLDLDALRDPIRAISLPQNPPRP